MGPPVTHPPRGDPRGKVPTPLFPDAMKKALLLSSRTFPPRGEKCSAFSRDPVPPGQEKVYGAKEVPRGREDLSFPRGRITLGKGKAMKKLLVLVAFTALPVLALDAFSRMLSAIGESLGHGLALAAQKTLSGTALPSSRLPFSSLTGGPLPAEGVVFDWEAKRVVDAWLEQVLAGSGLRCLTTEHFLFAEGLDQARLTLIQVYLVSVGWWVQEVAPVGGVGSGTAGLWYLQRGAGSRAELLALLVNLRGRPLGLASFCLPVTSRP